MIGGIVEVAESGRHLSVYRGFMRVKEDGAELGRAPLDDISALILSGPQVSLSKNLLVELAERKAVVVTCGRNWHPVSLTLPFDAHHQSAGVLHDQIAASTPLKKRLWQILVRAKIDNQRSILEHHHPGNPKSNELAILSRRVKSGDPENMEAQAARHYWTALMGENFRRDRFGEDANSYLNYGYTVLRAATARAVCAAGLHPSLGLHHGSRINAFALVDDLMEPFRPMVDSIAYELSIEVGNPEASLAPENKRRLVAILQQDMVAEKGASPLINCLGRLAQSLTAAFAEKQASLELPELPPPGHLL